MNRNLMTLRCFQLGGDVILETRHAAKKPHIFNALVANGYTARYNALAGAVLGKASPHGA
jgi:hypothetical protein